MGYDEEDLVQCHLEAILELHKESKKIPFNSIEHMEFVVSIIPREDIPLYINIEPSITGPTEDIYITQSTLKGLGISFRWYWNQLLKQALDC